MKKLFYTIFLLSASLVLFSCGDDDEKEKDPADMTPEEYMSENRPFVWNGDWNDPDDPNYKAEYNGKYNPLVGTYWISGDNSEMVKYYSKDFEYILYVYDAGRKTLKRHNTTPYIINDKGYKSEFYGYHLFFMMDDKKFLYVNHRGPGAGEGSLVYKKDWVECVRLDVTDDFIID